MVAAADTDKKGRPPKAVRGMKMELQRNFPTLSEVEADARRLQAEATAEMLRGLFRRIAGLFSATPFRNGRTA